jgi:glycosyltransferase involved in cell wall biosynthesis
MMRVAYICADPGVPVFGSKGCSVHVQEIVRALIRRGARVDLFAARVGGPVPEGLADVVVHQLPFAAKQEAAERERSQRGANAALDGALAEGAYDLVYERYSLWSHAGIGFAQRRGIPSVLEVNAPLIEEQAAHRSLVDREGAREVARQVFCGASEVVCVSSEVARYVESFGVPPNRVHVVPNGVSPERFDAHVPASMPAAGAYTIGFVGTLKPWHGLNHLVDAFAALHSRVPQARLLMVGDGRARAELEGACVSRGLGGRVDWTGVVAPADVPGLLRSMDVGVAPYPAMERFYFSPLKVLEYMAAGLAVVASDVGEVGQVVEDGRTGLLAPPGDAAALCDAMYRLWEDVDLRRRLGAAAREEVLAHHTWDQALARILALPGLSRRERVLS